MLPARWAWPLVTAGLLLGTGACSPSPSKVASRLTSPAPSVFTSHRPAVTAPSPALPTSTATPAPQWPMQLLVSGNALGVILDGAHAIAAVVAPGVGDSGYDFSKTEVVRVDTTTQQVTARARIPDATDLTLGGALLWVASQPYSPAHGLTQQTLYAYDPLTLALRRTIRLPVPSAASAPSMGYTQVVGTATDLWATDGDKVLDLDPASGVSRYAVQLPRGYSARTLALEAGGARVYISSADIQGDNHLAEWVPLTRRLTAGVPLSVVVPGSMAATSAGVWVAEPTGMHGWVGFYATGSLNSVHVAPPPPGHPTDYNGVSVALGGGALWVGDDMSETLRCANPVTGAAVQAEDLGVSTPVVVTGGRIYGGVLRGSAGLFAIMPPRSCFG
jgi:hypothetical protein